VTRKTSDSAPRKSGSLDREGEALKRNPSPPVPVIWTYVLSVILPGRAVGVGKGVGGTGGILGVTKRRVEVGPGMIVKTFIGRPGEGWVYLGSIQRKYEKPPKSKTAATSSIPRKYRKLKREIDFFIRNQEKLDGPA
jgi:hypothetical protein